MQLRIPCAIAIAGFLGTLTACPKDQKSDPDATPATASAAASTAIVPKGSVTVSIAYGSEKKTWLEDETKKFLATSPMTPSGKTIKIELKALGSGEAISGIQDGSLKPTVFSPASAAYLKLLNDQWLQTAGHTKPIAATNGDPLVMSPVVIAMWKPMAEALGWPAKSISWRDLLKVGADPKGWGSKGFPEWGRFKYGHCSPQYSNSGFLAVLAESYAGAKKTRDLTAADLDAKTTQDFLRDVEGTIIYYGKSTGFFGDKMVERGPKFLSAAVLYENLVIESYSKKPELPLVAVYPSEGTFWADHPFAILDAPWVDADAKAGAQAFNDFLRKKPAQTDAMALGFRPGDASIAIAAPIDEAHGVDPKQPQTVLPLPDGSVLAKLVPIWEQTKKGADVIFVFDKSGSMLGDPLKSAKDGAKSFIDHLSDRDQVTLMFFDGTVYPPVGPLKIGTDKAKLESRIDGVDASGGTALYDAISQAFDIAMARATKDPAQIHAVVVMTDGRDESSKLMLAPLEAKFPKEEAPVKVFTIAYGNQAESKVLTEIADSARGSSAKGSTETIKTVYEDMASFF